jgi:hypothetical protein
VARPLTLTENLLDRCLTPNPPFRRFGQSRRLSFRVSLSAGSATRTSPESKSSFRTKWTSQMGYRASRGTRIVTGIRRSRRPNSPFSRQHRRSRSRPLCHSSARKRQSCGTGVCCLSRHVGFAPVQLPTRPPGALLVAAALAHRQRTGPATAVADQRWSTIFRSHF